MTTHASGGIRPSSGIPGTRRLIVLMVRSAQA